MFGIKDGYRENPRPVYFRDDVTTTRGIVFQPDVYAMGEFLARRNELSRTVVDVGCGWADKLAAMHDRWGLWDYVGIDYGANIEHCKITYPWGTWIDLNLEHPGMTSFPMATVICSDVVEHLADPTPMLEMLAASEASTILISTPERDVQWGIQHHGPPPNQCHVREWNMAELRWLLEEAGLRVHWHGLTRSSDQGPMCATQLAVCS